MSRKRFYGYIEDDENNGPSWQAIVFGVIVVLAILSALKSTNFSRGFSMTKQDASTMQQFKFNVNKTTQGIWKVVLEGPGNQDIHPVELNTNGITGNVGVSLPLDPTLLSGHYTVKIYDENNALRQTEEFNR